MRRRTTNPLATLVVAVVALTAPLAVPALTGAQAQQTFRAGVDTVSVYATVRASDGRLVTDLTKDDFEITDNGVVREITNFSREIVPITVVMLLDMSGSHESGVDWLRRGAGAFVDHMIPADKARIGTFGLEIALSPRLTSDRVYLHRVLREEIWPGGATPLWQAIDLAMTSLAGEEGRRVILALTDGVDSSPSAQNRQAPLTIVPPGKTTASSAAANAALAGAQTAWADPPLYTTVRSRAERDGFTVYAVGHALKNGAAPMSPLSDRIQVLASGSGGGYRVFGIGADPAAALAEVAEELHRQYLIGFTSTALDGKMHRLEVDVKRGGMTVQARKSYLAAAR
jgi:VWFA-related protein